MAAMIIDGAALATKIRQQLRARVEALRSSSHAVHLATILCGATPAAQIYADRQKQSCSDIGIDYTLHTLAADASFDSIQAVIDRFNSDRAVTGIMVHLPVPKGVNATDVQHCIEPVKDVEGVSPANIGYVIYGQEVIVPCTALAAMELIRSTGYRLEGAEAVVVGASAIAGRPVALLLTEAGATVTICHKATRDLKSHTRRADVLVVAAGVPNLIAADHVREGAVVIDVGINRVTTLDGTVKTIGDVNFEDVQHKAAYLSPVPGGVGPMTVAMLLSNTVRSAELLAKSK